MPPLDKNQDDLENTIEDTDIGSSSLYENVHELGGEKSDAWVKERAWGRRWVNEGEDGMSRPLDPAELEQARIEQFGKEVPGGADAYLDDVRQRMGVESNAEAVEPESEIDADADIEPEEISEPEAVEVDDTTVEIEEEIQEIEPEPIETPEVEELPVDTDEDPIG